MIHHDSSAIEAAKRQVCNLCDAFDHAGIDELTTILEQHTARHYRWRGLHPFNEQQSATDVVDVFWKPLRQAFTSLQRRVDIFLASHNTIETPEHNVSTVEHANSIWTCQMGHFMGLMDKPWLDIPPTGRMVFIRFVEFHRIHEGVICESALFIDLISVMRQAGQYPLPPSTGASFIYPGPASSDGVLHSVHPPEQGQTTMALINRMIDDLSEANKRAQLNNDDLVPREVLARCWHENMLWYGPEGIGATYTIDRYQQQHQYPFRFNLSGKTFNGHICRFAEGNYGCFFGWPNLTNTARGGFMGLPASNIPADMRVTDIYRRQGDKLIENWVIIDLPHWLAMQGLDVLARMRQLLGVEKIQNNR
ncbi:MAG: hypothetical protein AB8B87_13585 [Granulosicoccus sp.]